MTSDAARVKLKNNQRVIVDNSDTGWTWEKTSGYSPEFVLYDENRVMRVNHNKRKVFVLKVLDFHNGCGEFG
nr:hypothetical protein [uncultured Roseovarius sp.]